MKLIIITFLVTNVMSQLQLSKPMFKVASSRPNVKTFAENNLDRRAMGGLLAAGAFGAFSPNAKAGSNTLPLATFDGTEETKRLWAVIPRLRTLKDKTELLVKGDVSAPALKANDEIAAYTLPNPRKPFADLSSCEGISLTAKTNTPYQGYSMSIGALPASTSPRSYLYKAKFDAPSEFGNVKIPFKDFLNPKGQTPDSKTVSDIQRLSVWGDREGGEVNLEVKDISGYGCSAATMLVQQEDEDLATSSTSLLWYLAPASLGFLFFFMMRIRARPSEASMIVPPLLG